MWCYVDIKAIIKQLIDAPLDNLVVLYPFDIESNADYVYFQGNIADAIVSALDATSRKRDNFELDIDLYAAKDTDKLYSRMKRIINAVVTANIPIFELVFRYRSCMEGVFNINETLLKNYIKEYCYLVPKVQLKKVDYWEIVISNSCQ